MQEAWVRSLVRELRSHMPWGAAKNFKKKNKKQKRIAIAVKTQCTIRELHIHSWWVDIILCIFKEQLVSYLHVQYRCSQGPHVYTNPPPPSPSVKQKAEVDLPEVISVINCEVLLSVLEDIKVTREFCIWAQCYLCSHPNTAINSHGTSMCFPETSI